MVSSVLWYNPDLPFGANLWSGNTKYIESFIRKCNQWNQMAGEMCNATFGEHAYEEFREEIEDSRDDYGELIDGRNSDGSGGNMVLLRTVVRRAMVIMRMENSNRKQGDGGSIDDRDGGG